MVDIVPQITQTSGLEVQYIFEIVQKKIVALYSIIIPFSS